MATRKITTVEGAESKKSKRYLGRSSRRTAIRDAAIVVDRKRGLTWPAIALKHDLSVSRCQEIVQLWRDDGLEGDGVVNAVDEARGLLDQLSQGIADYADLAERTRHDGVRLAAIRQRIETSVLRFELLVSLGMVPRPAAINVEAKMQEMFRAFAELAREHDVPVAFLEALLELSETRLQHEASG